MIIKDSEYADITTPTGPMRLHLFRPAAAGRYPAILLYSEIYVVPEFATAAGYRRPPLRRADPSQETERHKEATTRFTVPAY